MFKSMRKCKKVRESILKHEKVFKVYEWPEQKKKFSQKMLTFGGGVCKSLS